MPPRSRLAVRSFPARLIRAVGGAALAVLLLPALVAAQATPGGSPAALMPFPEPGGLPPAGTRAEGPLEVVATTGLVADFVRQVGGERVAVETILPANADPHDYGPAPTDLVAVEDAAAVFGYGLGLDAWAEDLIGSAGTDAALFLVTDGVPTLAPADGAHDGDIDPHAWFDPTRVELMAANIARDLAALDPAGAAAYDARRAAYAAQLAQLDAAIRDRIATIPAERRRIVTNHAALNYYAARYGLTIVGTVIPGLDTRAEPSAGEIAALLETVEREGVTAIFAENTTGAALAEQLAEEAGVTVVDTLYTDNLGRPGSGADTYLGLMRTNTELIVAALT